MIVGYNKVNNEGKVEAFIHQECATKAEAIDVAEAFVQASIEDETILEVLRGVRHSDTEVEYNVVYEIPRGGS